MRKFLTGCVACATLLVATAAFARGPFRLVQNPPEPAPALTPMPATSPIPGAEPAPVAGNTVELYQCVRIKDECNIAPCAVPQIVTVKDPCAVCDPCNPCAAPKCVAVQICVPPCCPCPPKVTCRRGGEYVKYDYGKYRIEITSRRGVVTVDYDD
jgi:hypothetical protein